MCPLGQQGINTTPRSAVAQHRTEQSRNTASNTTQNSKSNIKLYKKHQSDYTEGFAWNGLTYRKTLEYPYI